MEEVSENVKVASELTATVSYNISRRRRQNILNHTDPRYDYVLKDPKSFWSKQTALIPDFWLYIFDGKLYFAYPTLKGIESRNWEKPKKERQYPSPKYPGLQFTTEMITILAGNTRKLSLRVFILDTNGIKLNASTKNITLQEFEASTMSFYVRAPDMKRFICTDFHPFKFRDMTLGELGH
ncbi:hypothetical protein DAPPUDRAFT_324802 [Daphnia pulex]|uniref:Uncharacterized protein n=1 Tax=Daphnia pulex TaxID=6669 RepID=E9H2R7_DAPPU|nr:hypothetical protein DAPPUDRAFT_324802 [Daphnia pulex]|eukprot:EFX73831.1 hypothetical protein DAPPUDRAFT_324802 [Daphnia pulex]